MLGGSCWPFYLLLDHLLFSLWLFFHFLNFYVIVLNCLQGKVWIFLNLLQFIGMFMIVLLILLAIVVSVLLMSVCFSLFLLIYHTLYCHYVLNNSLHLWILSLGLLACQLLNTCMLILNLSIFMGLIKLGFCIPSSKLWLLFFLRIKFLN